MLVTLANNQTIAANASATYTYSPTSVQKVFLNLEDADAEDASITVQIGSTVICNGISAYGLIGYTMLQSGTLQNWATAEGVFLVLDFGNHECQQQDNLYVTVQSGSAEITQVDCSAIVDTPGRSVPPLRLTQYSDNTFTSPNNLMAISWNSSKGAVDEDAYNCEIRTSISSSAPSFISANSYYQSELRASDANGAGAYFGLLNQHGVPLSTTYNYPSASATDNIMTLEQMGETAGQRQQAQRKRSLALSQAGK